MVPCHTFDIIFPFINDQSINHVFQFKNRIYICFNIIAINYFCPTGATYSQKMWYSARALFIFTFFFLQWSSCSLLMAIFSKVLGHHSWRVLKIIKKKPILQPKLKWWIYVPIVVWRVFKRRGEWGEAAALAEEKSQQFGHGCILNPFMDQISQCHRVERGQPL